MPSVTSIFARRMVQAAGDSVDAAALLRSVGLDPEAPLDVTRWIAAESYYGLLERIANALGAHGHELPLRVGPLMRPDDYGALGLAWKSAPTVRDSLERVARYCRLWTDNMTYELREAEGGADFLLHREGERNLGMRLSNEATLSSAVSLIRQTASASFRPTHVALRHPAPASAASHERYFGCEVRFDAGEDLLRLDADSLAAPNHLADDGISRFLLSHLEQEIQSVGPGEEGIGSLVERAVSRALSEGAPKMADIAQGLAMSERTLQRRLAEHGLTFKEVVDRTRRQLAENLLRSGRYSLSEVGFLTGFSEQSAFQRAFKRWTGRTPAEFSKSG